MQMKPDSPQGRVFSRVAMAVLVASVAVTYEHARKLSFLTVDDGGYVTENPVVRAGLTWAGFRWAFVSFDRSNWHPLTWISHMLDCQVFGLDPTGPHLVNVLIHALNSVLLLVFLARATGGVRRSAMVAFLFALHPAHVESVAWIAERKDVLSTFFWLATWLAYARWTRTGKRGDRVAAIALFAAGLLCKPMLVTLPFTLLLLDYWPLGRFVWARRVWIEKLPFFALSAVAVALTLAAQSHGGAIRSLERLPLGPRLANVVVSYVRYAAKLVWPEPLSMYYPLRPDWSAGVVVGAVALLAAIFAFAVSLRRKVPFLLTGWLLFVGTLVPVIGLVQVGQQAMADRYTYVPSIGFFVMLVWGASMCSRARLRARWGALLAMIASATLLVVAARATTRYLRVWDTSATLFAHAIAVEPDFHHFAQLQMGVSLLQERKYREAGEHFGEVLRQAPGDPDAQRGLAEALEGASARADAGTLGAVLAALQASPDSGALHARAGALLTREGRVGEALPHLQRARELAQSPESYLNLANALSAAGDAAGARRELEAGRARYPADGRILRHLGVACLVAGEVPKGISYLEEAVRVDPSNASAQNDLGVALANTGDYEGAAQRFRRVIARRPQHVAAYPNLAKALLARGQEDQAKVVLGDLDALAQRHADAGEWADAVACTKAAAALARDLGMEERARDLAAREADWYKRAIASAGPPPPR